MRIDWMKTGTKHTQDKAKIMAIIGRMQWDDDFRGKQLPMMPALGIQAAIKNLKLPKVDSISYSCMELAPFGLYGVSCHFKNSDVKMFFVDEGSSLVPICAYVKERNWIDKHVGAQKEQKTKLDAVSAPHSAAELQEIAENLGLGS